VSIQSLDSRGSPLVTKRHSCSCATKGVSHRNWVRCDTCVLLAGPIQDTGAKVTSPYTAPAVAPCTVREKWQNPELSPTLRRPSGARNKGSGFSHTYSNWCQSNCVRGLILKRSLEPTGSY